METSAFLYENLSYSLLIWMHFGTSMLISYSLFLYVLPILFNIVLLFLPNFNFGFKATKADTAGGGGLPTIPASIVTTLNDSKVFAGIFSRNPKLFETIPMQEVKSFFSNLDDKLGNILVSVKDLPTSDDEKDSEKTGETSVQTTSQSSAPGAISDVSGEENVDGKEIDTKQKSGKSGKKTILVYGNLLFFAAIIIVNIYTFIYYNGLLDEYFVIKKSLIKYSENDYQLDYNKLKTVKDKDKVELIKNVSMYVEIINSVKADKRKREKALEGKEEGKK